MYFDSLGTRATGEETPDEAVAIFCERIHEARAYVEEAHVCLHFLRCNVLAAHDAESRDDPEGAWRTYRKLNHGIEGVRIPYGDHSISKMEDDIRSAAIDIDRCLIALKNAAVHCGNYLTARRSEAENKSNGPVEDGAEGR